jgi:hypothetical protein
MRVGYTDVYQKKNCKTLYCLQMSGMLRIVNETDSWSDLCGCSMLRVLSFTMVKGVDRLCGSIPNGKSSDVDADENEEEEQLSFGETGHSKCSSLFDVVFTWSYSGGRHDGSL